RAARILIVDDDPLVGRWLTEVLTTEGHLAEAVESGRAALERLRESPFDLVLSDLRMPDLDGVGLYQELAHPAADGAAGDLRLRQLGRASLPALPGRARGPQPHQALRHRPAHPPDLR